MRQIIAILSLFILIACGQSEAAILAVSASGAINARTTLEACRTDASAKECRVTGPVTVSSLAWTASDPELTISKGGSITPTSPIAIYGSTYSAEITGPYSFRVFAADVIAGGPVVDLRSIPGGIVTANTAADYVGKRIKIIGAVTLTANLTLATNRSWDFIDASITTTGYTLDRNRADVLMPELRQVFFGSGSVIGLKDPTPEMFGGGDGLDSGAAINKAIMACGNAGGKVRLGIGSYIIETPININRLFINLEGSSNTSTYLIPKSNALCPYIIKMGYNGSPSSAGVTIQKLRFSGYTAASENYNGIGIYAPATSEGGDTHSFIDSNVLDCWFGLSNSAVAAFKGVAVNATFDRSTYELQGRSLWFQANSSISRITNSLFYATLDEGIYLEGTVSQPINDIILDDLNVTYHIRQSFIRAEYATFTLNALRYTPSDTIPDSSYVTTVIDLSNSVASVSSATIRGNFLGISLFKINSFAKLSNSTINVSGPSFLQGTHIFHAMGDTNFVYADNVVAKDSLSSYVGYIESGASGLLSIRNSHFSNQLYSWIFQNPCAMDTLIQNNFFDNAQYTGISAGNGFVLDTTGILRLEGNNIKRTDTTLSRLNYVWSIDHTNANTAIIDKNIIALTTLTGSLTQGTGSNIYGSNIGLYGSVTFAFAMPTAGTYRQGDIVYNAVATVGQPVGWARLTNGAGHVLNTDWKALPNL